MRKTTMNDLLRKRLDKIGGWIREDKSLWDVLVGMRGPDAGTAEASSERPCHDRATHDRLYAARVARKMRTVAVLRAAAFGDVPGARVRRADTVTLPPARDWDHFDKHVALTAGLLGVRVEVDHD